MEFLNAAGNKTTVSAANPAPVTVSAPFPLAFVGNVASGAVDNGAPVKVGALAYGGNAWPTYVDGQRGNLVVGVRGSLRIEEHLPGGAGTFTNYNNPTDGNANSNWLRGVFSLGAVFNGTTWDRLRGDLNGIVVQTSLTTAQWSYAALTGGIVNTSDVAVKASGGASVRNFVDSIQFKNTSAVASEIVIKDGSTVLWRGHASASMTAMETINFVPPLKGTAATAVNVAMATTATATLVNLQGHTGT